MSGSLKPPILEIDSVTIEPVPTKKGIILRHVEYQVKSEHFRSDVTRRYSDFQTLSELLLYRYQESVKGKVTYNIFNPGFHIAWFLVSRQPS